MDSSFAEFERYGRPSYENLEKAKEGVDSVSGLIEKMKSKSIESMKVEGTSAEISLLESEVGGGEPTFVISWAEGSFVKFVPVTEGAGAEKGMFGYQGYYGYQDGKETKEMPIEFPFSATESGSLTKPQIRFHLTEAYFGEEKNFAEDNTYDVWVGMGMLLLDEENMHLINHELGHIDHQIEVKFSGIDLVDEEYQASLRARKMTSQVNSEGEYPGAQKRGLYGLEKQGKGISKKGRRSLQIMEWAGIASHKEPKAGRVDQSARLFATNAKDLMADKIEKAKRLVRQTDMSLLWR